MGGMGSKLGWLPLDGASSDYTFFRDHFPLYFFPVPIKLFIFPCLHLGRRGGKGGQRGLLRRDPDRAGGHAGAFPQFFSFVEKK